MSISRQMLADQLARYLNHRVSKEELIEWCERTMQEENFENGSVKAIVARIGLMDAENFEITYEDLWGMLKELGYQLRVEVV